MSRDVDINDPSSWSEEDIKYLHDRAQLTNEQYQEAMDRLGGPEGVRPAGARPLEEQGNTGDINSLNLTQDQYQELVNFLAKMTGQDPDADSPTIVVRKVDRSTDEAAGEYDPDDYATWSKEQLQDEVRNRNEKGADLAVSGAKKDLVKRLDDDDRKS